MKNTLRLLALSLVFAGCTNGLDFSTPRLYACDRAAGLEACPGGWRCGLSGFCQNPDQALPYACETSADCSTTWHCGPERLCYDRAAASDRTCRASLEGAPDAGDCAPGWRCGKEVRGQVCHPLDAGAAYGCTADSDCEAAWRCGTEGQCVDVAAQGLLPGEVTFSVSKLSPRLPSQVDLVEVRVFPAADGSGAINKVVFAAEGRLTVATNSVDLGNNFRASRDSAALLRPAHALAETEAHLLVTDSTGLVDYRDAIDGGAPRLLVPELANAELRYAPGSGGTQEEELASFSGSTIGLCGRGALLRTCDPTSSFERATVPATVTDITFLEGASRRSVLAATSAGLYFAPRQGASFITLDGGLGPRPEWRPMTLSGISACSPTPTPVDRALYDDKDRMLAVTTDQDRQLSIYKQSGVPQSPSACAPLAFEPDYGPCAACGRGEVLLKLGSDDSYDQMSPELVAVCRRSTPDAGGETVVSYLHHSTDGGCNLEPKAVTSGASRGYQISRQSPGLQGLDAVGMAMTCPHPGCGTMLYATAPDRVAGGPALLETHNVDVPDMNGLHQAPVSGLSSELGVRLVKDPDLYVAGSVAENPDWMISSTGRIGTLGDQQLAIHSMSRRRADQRTRPLALISRSSNLVPSLSNGGQGLIDSTNTAAFSTLTTDADGQPWIIVGAGDRIWADDPRRFAMDGGTINIGIKTVPMPGGDIQSLAFAAFDRGDAGTGALLDGYTVEQQRLFRVVVHTPALWLPEEIRLTRTNTVPLTVWMEGNRGRVGTSDGRVFGLPVPVPISEAIPELVPTVLTFGSLCGRAFALSATALYRLSLETPPLGTWKRVLLEAAQPGLDDYGPHWGRVMHKARVGNQEHLYLFSDTGLVVKLEAICN